MLQLPALSLRSSPNYSSRNGSRVSLFVVHDCEGSFEGSISWFAQAKSRVSAHVVLSADGKQAVQMVSWKNKAWHACYYNPISESLEMAGFTSKGFSPEEWLAAAAIVAFRLKANGLPPVWAKAGLGDGFCSHYDLGARGGGHLDPTTDSAVWGAFVKMVQDAYQQPMPAAWEPVYGLTVLPPSPDWKPKPGIRHDHEVGSLTWVQLQLNALRIPVTNLNVDGLDGPKTREALRRFQQQHGLFVDGDVGPKTIAKLVALGV